MLKTPAEFDAVEPRITCAPWGLLCVAPGLLFVAILAFAPNFRDHTAPREHPYGGDFLQEWVGGRLILDGQSSSLYDLETSRRLQHAADGLGFSWHDDRYFPMVYPPFYYWLVSPLALLPYKTAATVWLALMTAALSASLLLINDLSRCRWWVLAICLCFPVVLSLSTGQKGTLLLLILTATFYLLRNQKPLAAGAIFALIAFKPHLAIPLGLVMLWKRQWRFLAGCALTLSAQLTLCAVIGPGVCRDYFNVCLQMNDYLQTGGYHLEQGFSLWSGFELMMASSWTARIATLLSIVGVFSALVFAFRGPIKTYTDRFAIQFSAVVVATILVSPHFYAYDLSVLVLPAALVWLVIANHQTACKSVVGLIGSLAALLLITGQLIWLTVVTGIPVGVVMALVTFGLLIHWINGWSKSSSAVFGNGLLPASSCDIARCPSRY